MNDRPTRFRVEFTVDGAALIAGDSEARREIVVSLRQVAFFVNRGETSGSIFDLEGENVGTFGIEEES